MRTYLDKASAAYALDRIFTDRYLHSWLAACRVMADGVVEDLSDHAPLVADFVTEASEPAGDG